MRQMFTGQCGTCGNPFEKFKRGNQPYQFCSQSCSSIATNRGRPKMSENERVLARRNSVRNWRLRNSEKVKEYKMGRYVRGTIKPHLSHDEKEQITTLYEGGLNFRQISSKIGRGGGTISRFLRENRFIPPRPMKSGPGSTSWKGGRVLSHGYSYLWVSSDDPMAVMRDKAGRIAEHRLTLARKLGRPLLAHETVHHVDGDITNNSPDNLQLRQGRHGKHIAMCCLDCGSHNIGPAQLMEAI
jgi:hypothetical protein